MIVVIQKYKWLPQLAFGKERYSLILLHMWRAGLLYHKLPHMNGKISSGLLNEVLFRYH